MRRFGNILLVIEPGADNQVAIDRAFELATTNDAALSLISVVEEAPILRRAAPDILETLVAERTDELQEIGSRWSGDVSVFVPMGRPFLEIIRCVLQNGHDLVIKSQARGLKRFSTLGSMDMHVLRKCPCPVWIVRSEGTGFCRRVLAAVDIASEGEEATALARRVLEIATSLANNECSDLYVLHAWSLPYEETLRSPRSGMLTIEVDRMAADEEQLQTRNLEALVGDVLAANKTALESADWSPSIVVKKGNPDGVIPDFVTQSDIDLVVMGTVGRTGIPGFFIGNTAEEILAHIDCSVLAIKPPGFESPVTIA